MLISARARSDQWDIDKRAQLEMLCIKNALLPSIIHLFRDPLPAISRIVKGQSKNLAIILLIILIQFLFNLKHKSKLCYRKHVVLQNRPISTNLCKQILLFWLSWAFIGLDGIDSSWLISIVMLDYCCANIWFHNDCQQDNEMQVAPGPSKINLGLIIKLIYVFMYRIF